MVEAFFSNLLRPITLSKKQLDDLDVVVIDYAPLSFTDAIDPVRMRMMPSKHHIDIMNPMTLTLARVRVKPRHVRS